MADEILLLKCNVYAYNKDQDLNTNRPALDITKLVPIGTYDYYIVPVTSEQKTNVKNIGERVIYTGQDNGSWNSYGQILLNNIPNISFARHLPYSSLTANNISSYWYRLYTGNRGIFPLDQYMNEVSQKVRDFLAEQGSSKTWLQMILQNPVNGYYTYSDCGYPSGQNYGHVWDAQGNILLSQNQHAALFGASYDAYVAVNTYDYRDANGVPHLANKLALAYRDSEIYLYRNGVYIDDEYYISNLETKFIENTPINPPPTDPYSDGGTSTTGGGTGTFDGTTAAVDFPSGTPTAGAGNSGFIKLFNPSAQNLADLAAYLWGTYDISSFKSIYNNPIDCIIALVVVPVTPTTGSAAAISLGNIATTVNANVITSQFTVLDCGSLNINEYWGAYLDYDPYTKCEIYLPYIGVQDIDINDIQGKTIQLKYYIDVLSGACVAMLKAGDDILYNWSGQCAAEIPITSTGFGSVFQTALSAANAIGETIVNAMSGIPQTLSLVASSVFNGARSKVHKSGSIGSMAGHMGIQKPYLIITRPVQSVPENLNEITGYPSNITATLGDLTGYTEIDTIHLSGIPATSEELAEIDELLKGGVFI